MDENEYLNEDVRYRCYQQVAENVLTLLPQEIKVFELSADIHAARYDKGVEEKKEIYDSGIVDLDTVKGFVKQGRFNNAKGNSKDV